VKLAIVTDHYEKRSDVRQLVKNLSVKVELTVFVEKLPLCNDGITFKKIPEVGKGVVALAVRFLYTLFRKRHRLRKESVSWRTRKLSGSFGFKQLIQIVFFWVEEFIPKLLSYDFYVSKLIQISEHPYDFDRVIFLSEICSDELFSSFVKKRIPVYIYIYSWDHIIKLRRVSRNHARYLVWSAEQKKELADVHCIPDHKISIVGSTQLCYVDQFLTVEKSLPEKVKSKTYIYFISTKGRSEFLEQEFELLDRISRFVSKLSDEYFILYRPYPNADLSHSQIQHRIVGMSNVVIDWYRDDGYVLTRDKIFQKYSKIVDAALVVHTGGTIAIEVSLLGCEAVYFNFAEDDAGSQTKYPFYLRLGQINQQYHLKRYVNRDFENVIGSYQNLELAIKKVVNEHCSISTEFNNEVALNFPVKSFEMLTQDFSNLELDGRG